MAGGVSPMHVADIGIALQQDHLLALKVVVLRGVVAAHDHHRTVRHVVAGKPQPRHIPLITIGAGQNINRPTAQGFHRLRPLSEAHHLHGHIEARADQAQVVGADALVAIMVTGDINRLVVSNGNADLQCPMARQPLLLACRQRQGGERGKRRHQFERQAVGGQACRRLTKQEQTQQPHTPLAQ